MARRRRPRSQSSETESLSQRARDDAYIATTALLDTPRVVRPVPGYTRLNEVEDLRTWSPPSVGPRRRSGVSARIVKSQKPSRLLLAGRLSFDAPDQVLVCVRRTRRRQVLHARGVAGSKVRRGRKGRYSHVRC